MKFKIIRTNILRSIDEAIEFVTKPIIDDAEVGLKVSTSYGIELRLHLILLSYVIDTPEEEDPLSVKKGVPILHTCHPFPASCEKYPYRNNKDTQKLRPEM